MDTFAPGFSRFWLPAGEDDAQRIHDGHNDYDGDATLQQQALDELTERVNAARRVI